jgi:hypothetical protein
MRASLFTSKLEGEARSSGKELDDVLEDGFAEIFGEADFVADYDGKPPEEIPIRKMHNPWFYINPSLKGGELLKFVRSKESVYYRESSRIPAQRVDPVVAFQEPLPSKVVRREPAPGKKSYHLMWDISKSKNLYDRMLVVRDLDGKWRTGTWEERRKVHDFRRHLKFPYTIPFPWPDETQIDGIPVHAKAPSSFQVRYEGDDDLSYNTVKNYDWGELYEKNKVLPDNELNRLKKIKRREEKAVELAAREASKAAAAAPPTEAAATQ